MNAIKTANFSSQNITFMQEALVLAKQAALYNEVPIGAIVVMDNKIIGKGYNCPISTDDPTAHAEIIALRDAARHLHNYRLPQVTLYTTLEPCLMCVGAMLHARVQHLFFGAIDPKAGAVVSICKAIDIPGINYKIHYNGGLLADPCGQILKDFFANKRKGVKSHLLTCSNCAAC